MKQTLGDRRGTTLVELVVCMMLVAIFALAAASLIRPCAEVFVRMQNLSRAQMISDTVVEYLRGELLHAQGTLRLCDAGLEAGGADRVFRAAQDPSGSRGSGVEFQVSTNVDRGENDVGRGDRAAAYKLIDAGVVPQTASTRTAAGTALWVFEEGRPAGALHERYFMPVAEGGYRCRNEAGQYAAYEGTDAFPDAFYMGMVVRLDFMVYSWLPRSDTDPVRVTALDVKVEVFASEEAARNDLPLHSRRAILDLADAPELVQGETLAHFAE